MKKIAIITIYHVPNYGSVLQTYATQRILEKLGYACDIIRYRYPNHWHFSQGMPKPTWKSKIAHWLGLKPVHRKAKKLHAFRKKHLHLTHEYADLEALTQEDWMSKYDLAAVGSDQVWNTRFNKGDEAFVLSFLPDEMKRISIASSFASKSIDAQYKEHFYKHLSKFSAISVREENGKEIIDDLFGGKKRAEVLLDPTLLMDKDEWLQLIPNKSEHPNKGRKYILLYGLYYAFDPRPYIFEVVKFYKEQLDCDVIALNGEPRPCDNCGFEYINVFDSTIEEFLNLFNHAELVITSSFHGTAFALNFSRPLISIVPDNGDDRISTLLEKTGNMQSIFHLGEDYKPIYTGNKCSTDTELKLAALRIDSINWIQNAIN